MLLMYAPAALERKWLALSAPALDVPLPVLEAVIATAAAKRAAGAGADANVNAGSDACAGGVAMPSELGGLGLTPSQALRLVAAHPSCLACTTVWLLARRAWLLQLGVPDVGAVITGCPTMLTLSISTLDEKRALLVAHGACPRTIFAAMPNALNKALANLGAKLAFAREVIGLSVSTLERVPIYLNLSLLRTRLRFFLLEQLANGALPPWRADSGEPPRGPSAAASSCSPVTWIGLKDEKFAARALRSTPAAAWGVAAMHAHMATPAFGAWADAREVELRAFHAKHPPPLQEAPRQRARVRRDGV
jgi:hypothetical protein